MKLALHWFRRHLRVTDNTALHHASRRAERVLPIFILEDALRTAETGAEAVFANKRYEPYAIAPRMLNAR
jgi:deoxyribodipyrimidine photolyase